MSIQLGRKPAYSVTGQRPTAAIGTLIGPYSIQWRRYSKFALGAALIAIGVGTTYQQVFVRVSREAVINARVATIRAPMDGIVTTASVFPGQAVQAGAPIGDIEDPTADDERVFQLQQELHAAERENTVLALRLADLQRSRAEADARAEAYRIGRVQQAQLRVEEAKAKLSAAMARQSDAIAAETRGAALNARGYMANSAYEGALHAREVAQQEVIAARRRLDALNVEMEAARSGTYLGDNYNDVPSSFQRSRELSVRIDETEATLQQLVRKQDMLVADIVAEQKRLAARSRAPLASALDGNLWTVQVATGEYVRKGQELFTVLDCSTVVVTASVFERDYNELRIGYPVTFRISGSSREYSGTISKLGLTSTERSFAIAPEERRHQVAVQLPDLQHSDSDRCAVGRTGEVVFEQHGGRFGARLVESLRHLIGSS